MGMNDDDDELRALQGLYRDSSAYDYAKPSGFSFFLFCIYCV